MEGKMILFNGERYKVHKYIIDSSWSEPIVILVKSNGAIKLVPYSKVVML